MTGFEGLPGKETFLEKDRALELFDTVKPSGNIEEADKKQWLSKVLEGFDMLRPQIEALQSERAEKLQESHDNLRKAIKSKKVKVKALYPPDVVALSVVLPKPRM